MNEVKQEVRQLLVGRGYDAEQAGDMAEAMEAYFNRRMVDEVPQISKMLEKNIGNNSTVLVLRGHEVPLGRVAKATIALFFALVAGYLLWYAFHLDKVTPTYQRNVFIVFVLFAAIGVTMFATAFIKQLKARRLPPVQLEGGLSHG